MGGLRWRDGISMAPWAGQPRAGCGGTPPYRVQGSCRLWPDPVALRRRFAGDSAVVLLVPADGVEDELPVSGAVILEGLAADDVVRHLLRELRHERLEGFGVLAVRQAVAFQPAGEGGRTGDGLV